MRSNLKASLFCLALIADAVNGFSAESGLAHSDHSNARLLTNNAKHVRSDSGEDKSMRKSVIKRSKEAFNRMSERVRGGLNNFRSRFSSKNNLNEEDSKEEKLKKRSFKQKLSDAHSSAVAGGKKAMGKLKSGGSNFINSAKQFKQNPGAKSREWGTKLANGIKSMGSTIATKTRNAGNTLVRSAKSSMPRIFNRGGNKKTNDVHPSNANGTGEKSSNHQGSHESNAKAAESSSEKTAEADSKKAAGGHEESHSTDASTKKPTEQTSDNHAAGDTTAKPAGTTTTNEHKPTASTEAAAPKPAETATSKPQSAETGVDTVKPAETEASG